MSSKRLSQHALRELGIDEASIRAATPEPSAEADAALQDALWYRFKAWEERAARNGSGMVGDQMTGASMMLGWLTQEGALRPATPPLTDE